MNYYSIWGAYRLAIIRQEILKAQVEALCSQIPFSRINTREVAE